MNLSVLTAEASKGMGAKDKEITRLNAMLDNIKNLAPEQFAECERLRLFVSAIQRGEA